MVNGVLTATCLTLEALIIQRVLCKHWNKQSTITMGAEFTPKTGKGIKRQLSSNTHMVEIARRPLAFESKPRYKS